MTDRLRHTVLNLSRICRGIGKQVAGFDSSIVNPIDLLTEDRSHHHHTVLNARIYYYIEWLLSSSLPLIQRILAVYLVFVRIKVSSRDRST